MRQTISRMGPARQKRPKFSLRAFYLTVLTISSLAVLSFFADQAARYAQGTQYGAAQRQALESRDTTQLFKRDEECRLVHHAEDKCAFIKANCPDEEAGLLSYLSLYYCDLNSARPVAFVIMVIWLGLLFTTIGIAASDFFCINLSTIASILGMSESMAGVTFLAFGNGSPDVFSTFAAMNSHSGSLAIGELIGAAGFITAVVAGSMALVREFRVGKKTFVRDVGFFIVAASFTMAFLADGRLHLWECCVMIGFYVFYVITVVVWHWYLGRRRMRREREAAARGHFLAVPNEELEVAEEDGDDEDAQVGRGRYRDVEDFEALERAASPYGSHVGDDSDDDGGQGMHLAAEMANSMRVTRPPRHRHRSSTITPIRPSLMGALEFRSVLSSLQKSRGSHARPIHLRRYSDDPLAVNLTSQYTDRPALEPYSDDPSNSVVSQGGSETSSRPGPSARGRAVSMNDAAAAKPQHPAAFTVAQVPNIGVVAATPTFPDQLNIPDSTAEVISPSGPVPPSPTISLSPPPTTNGSRDVSPAPPISNTKRDTLAPPEGGFPGARHLRSDFDGQSGTSSKDSPRTMEPQRPRLQIPASSSRDSSRSRTLSPIIQFPTYTDSPLPMSARSSRAPSILLPEAALTPQSTYGSNDLEDAEMQERPIRWWPYRVLPSPYALGSTLFPTLCGWREKSVWDKLVSIISVPSIFLLAITLPVVESESHNDDESIDPAVESQARKASGVGPALTLDSPSLEPREPEWIRYRRATGSYDSNTSRNSLPRISEHDTAAVAVSAENQHKHNHTHGNTASPKQNSIDPLSPTPSSKDWNRWLVVMQLFTAPQFVVCIVWANTEDATTKYLAELVLYSLLGSLIAFFILTLTTTPSQPPKYRFLLCFLGFVVAIAWISTIANEVVGVLKAFGVILGISDAILGLTIFAVGNSLGDLVADITVARLGYPVMALSACFGGPMLNILLGIGISGLYMTIKESNHRHEKHPDKQFKYKPYHISVSRTLTISAVTLLITLIGLLIAVPMNKWVMSKRIGYGLITLWSISTIVNLAVEISGVGGETTALLW